MVNTKFFIILLLFLFIPIAVADDPNYNIIVRFDDKNIKSGESIPFTIDVKGNGICIESNVDIFTEGWVEELNKKVPDFFYTDNTSINLKRIPSENIKTEVNTGSCCISEDERTKSIHISTNSLKFNISDSNYLRIKSKLDQLDNSEGGNYDFTVLFSCKSENNTWLTFTGKNQYSIMYENENLQFILQWIIPLITLLLGSILGFLSTVGCIYIQHQKENKKEIYSPLFNELNVIIDQLNKFEMNSINHPPDKEWQRINKSLSYNLNKNKREEIKDFYNHHLNEYVTLKNKASVKINNLIENELIKRGIAKQDYDNPNITSFVRNLYSQFFLQRLFNEQGYIENKFKEINNKLKNNFSNLNDFFKKILEIINKDDDIKQFREKQKETVQVANEIICYLEKKLNSFI